MSPNIYWPYLLWLLAMEFTERLIKHPFKINYSKKDVGKLQKLIMLLPCSFVEKNMDDWPMMTNRGHHLRQNVNNLTYVNILRNQQIPR